MNKWVITFLLYTLLPFKMSHKNKGGIIGSLYIQITCQIIGKLKHNTPLCFIPHLSKKKVRLTQSGMGFLCVLLNGREWGTIEPVHCYYCFWQWNGVLSASLPSVNINNIQYDFQKLLRLHNVVVLEALLWSEHTLPERTAQRGLKINKEIDLP